VETVFVGPFQFSYVLDYTSYTQYNLKELFEFERAALQTLGAKAGEWCVVSTAGRICFPMRGKQRTHVQVLRCKERMTTEVPL
jgi:hypothetical protein